MDISTIMSRMVITAEPESGLRDICDLMARNRIGSVVVTRNNSPLGIVTERDIVIAVAEHGNLVDLTAESVMHAPILSVAPVTDIQSAIELMRNNRIRRLPITVGEKLVGIVTYGDILRYIRKELADSEVQVEALKGEVATDSLTGAFSRSFFDQALEREVNRVKEHGGFLSLLMIDIDFFKQFNDSVGHAGGDIVLTQVASMIMLNVRDINMVCRFGGDEFAVIAPISDINGAMRMAERLRQVIEATIIFYKHDKLKTTLSIGVASWKSSLESAAGLMEAADQALYSAKEAGRNRVFRARTPQKVI